MFGIGFFELLLLFVVALLVLGPEKLPKLARTLGLWYGKMRRTVSKIQNDIEQELDLVETRKAMQAEIEKIKATEQQMQEKILQMEENFNNQMEKEQESLKKDNNKA